jgi:hypothetical protein
MAEIRWIGGTTAVTQVDTCTIANTWAASDTMTSTLTAEDGSTTQVVNTTVSSSTLATCISEHLADLQASTQSMFAAITWTAASPVITATAKVSGVPFYLACSETTAGDGTYTRASSTANQGPNDLNTGGNYVWSAGSGVPTTGSHNLRVIYNNTDETSYDILYGLNQSGVTLTGSVLVSPTFKGVIGQSENSYYYQINGTTLTLNGRGPSNLINGTFTTGYVIGTAGTPSAAKLDGDIQDLYIIGPNVIGTVTLADSMTQDNLRVHGCPGAIVKQGASISAGGTLVEISSGNVTLESVSGGTLNITGGSVIIENENDSITAVNLWGGLVDYRGAGTITFNLRGGTLDFSNSKHDQIVFSSCVLQNGTVMLNGGMQNVGTSTITQHGGQILSDTGVTVDVQT